MEINNMKKLDLGKLANANPKRDWILRSELNIGKGMEKIMVLKPEEIKEIIKKMEEFYNKWKGTLGEIGISSAGHMGGGRGGH
jgi:hypothetical protein